MPTRAASPDIPPVARRTSWLLLGLLALVLPLYPLQNIIDKIDQPLRGLPGVNFINLSALLLVGLWFGRTLFAGRPLVGRSLLNRTLGLFILLTYLGLWRAVSYVDAPLPLGPSDPSFVFWKDAMLAFVLFFVAANTIHDERTMRLLSFAMLLVLPYMVHVHNDNLSWATSWHYDHDMRVNGTMLHLGSNELAAFYVVALLVSAGLLLSLRDLQWRLFFLLSTGLAAWGVIYSYSRSAYLAALVGAALMGLLRSLKLTLVLLLFLLAAPLFLPASVLDRFGMINSEQTQTDESTERRLELWTVAWERFQENPVLGTGYRSFPKLNRYNMDTHNNYLKVLCELGLFGFLAFLGLFVHGFRQGWLLSRQSPTPFARGLGMGVMAASLGLLVLNFFGDRASYLAVTCFFWTWQGMAARILRAVRYEGGWAR